MELYSDKRTSVTVLIPLFAFSLTTHISTHPTLFNYISGLVWLSRAPWQHPPSLSTTANPRHPTAHLPDFHIFPYKEADKKA